MCVHIPTAEVCSSINHKGDFMSTITPGCGHMGVELQHIMHRHTHTQKDRPAVLKVKGIELAGLSVLSACNDVPMCIRWSKYRAYSGHLSYIK